MKRLLTAMRWDAQLQFRYGFYYAGVFVAVVNIILLTQLFSPDAIVQLLAPFVLEVMLVTGFFFISGLVLFEKDENVLEALVVTPLRTREYLLSKALTLVIVSLLEGALVVILSHGFNLNWLLLLLGAFSLGAIGVFIGFVMVSRYDSLNEFLLPAGLLVTALLLPIVQYAGLVTGPFEILFYLLPSQPGLILMKAAFLDVATWEWVYGILASLIWLGITFWAAQRAYLRFIVRRQGVVMP